MTDFYRQYDKFKSYSVPEIKEKNVEQFDREFWLPTACTLDHAVLEIGCGTGQFLLYLQRKGVRNFVGIDANEKLTAFIPEAVAGQFQACGINEFLDSAAGAELYDRIVLFDVLEHFSHEDGSDLLVNLKKCLRPDGLIVIRLPNLSSPWGGSYQYGDLTHKAAYNPTSIRQLAISSGYECRQCFAQISGSRKRQMLDKVFHKFLSSVLMTPPEIWSANFLAILHRQED